MVIIDTDTNDISLTRGDYAALVFTAYEDEGTTIHDLAMGDTVQFQMGKKYGKPDVVKTKVKEDALATSEDDYVIEIEPEDTKSLKFGDYFYDVSIVTATGEVCTYIGDTGDNEPKFTILKEVGGTNE